MKSKIKAKFKKIIKNRAFSFTTRSTFNAKLFSSIIFFLCEIFGGCESLSHVEATFPCLFGGHGLTNVGLHPPNLKNFLSTRNLVQSKIALGKKKNQNPCHFHPGFIYCHCWFARSPPEWIQCHSNAAQAHLTELVCFTGHCAGNYRS